MSKCLNITSNNRNNTMLLLMRRGFRTHTLQTLRDTLSSVRAVWLLYLDVLCQNLSGTQSCSREEQTNKATTPLFFNSCFISQLVCACVCVPVVVCHASVSVANVYRVWAEQSVLKRLGTGRREREKGAHGRIEDTEGGIIRKQGWGRGRRMLIGWWRLNVFSCTPAHTLQWRKRWKCFLNECVPSTLIQVLL